MATKAEKLLAKGQGFEKKGKLERALECYREACAESPYDPELWQARGECAHKLGHTPEAADALFRVSDMFARGGMPMEALKVVRRVLEIDAQHGGAKRFLRLLESRLAPAEPDEPAPAPPTAAAPKPRMSAPENVVTEPEEPVVTIAMPADESAPQAKPAEVKPAEPPREPEPEARTITIEADEPEPMDLFRAAEPTPPPVAATAPAAVATLPAAVVSASELPVSMLATNGSVPAHDFHVGPTTTELALDSLSLGERLVAASPSAAHSEIPLDDEPRVDVVQAVASTLTTSPLLSELDSDLVKMLVECGTLVHRAEASNVFRQGETGTALFLILRGEVAVIREPSAGEKEPPRELARLRAGAFFGEMAVLTNAPRSATVRAITSVDLLEISRRDLRAMIDREARVLKLIMRFFRARMVGTLLQTSPLFKLFSRDEKRQLVSSFRLRELGPGYEVLEEGTKTEGLFLVLAGKLEAVRASAVLGALGPGDIFGEMSLLEDAAAMATVRAKTRAWVLILPRADFVDLSAKHPAIVDQLRTLATERRTRNQATLAANPQAAAESTLTPV